MSVVDTEVLLWPMKKYKCLDRQKQQQQQEANSKQNLFDQSFYGH